MLLMSDYGPVSTATVELKRKRPCLKEKLAVLQLKGLYCILMSIDVFTEK